MQTIYKEKKPYTRPAPRAPRSKEETRVLATRLAAESMVLLKNEENLLPFAPGASIALFGRSQIDTLIGGSGSGAARNVEESVTILDACRSVGLAPVAPLADFYREKIGGEVKEDPFAALMGQGADLVNSGIIYEIFGKYQPTMAEYTVPEELMNTARAQTDTALLILGRSSGGEECDRHVPEDFELTGTEKALIAQVCGAFDRVALVLNVNGAIDLSWVRDYPCIRSILFAGLPGQYGADAIARILTGSLTPCGKLSFTWAPSYDEWPTAANFSWDKDRPETILEYKDFGLDAEAMGSVGFEKSPVTVYQEDIYLGYRYFDSFGKDVLYPFGFGLSYVDFSLKDARVGREGRNMTAEVTVSNVSPAYSGREVVQLYVSAPSGKLKQAYQELKGFAKTRPLAPGESEQISIGVPLRELASFDEDAGAWYLEKGTYFVRIGSSSRDTHIAGAFTVEEALTLEPCAGRMGLADACREKIEFLDAAGQTPFGYAEEAKEKEQAAAQPAFVIRPTDRDALLPTETSDGQFTASAAAPNGQTAPITLQDVAAGRARMEDFTAQMTIEELAVLATGYGPGLPFGGFGAQCPPTISYADGSDVAVSTHATGRMGYVSPALIRYGMPSIFYKDGPASVEKTAWPTGMLLACSFDPELLYAFGEACGGEAAAQDVDSWLAPALNLHRNPIGGRNFEYFSEDPVLAGACGCAVCLGAEENHPVTACPKHFAVNEQETYRRGSSRKHFDAVDSILTERAARELYLKPFEMAVRGSNVCTLMSSFNKVNGVFAAGNRALCTDILRGWGYKGIVVTDWGDMDVVVDGADAVAAGNDIVMPGGPPVIAQILKGYEEGRVARSDLERTAARLARVVLRSQSYQTWLEKEAAEPDSSEPKA